MERLRLRAPPLPFEENARWTEVRNAYAKDFAAKYKGYVAGAVGPAFVKLINGVLEALGEHYTGGTEFKAAGKKGGDPGAFGAFFRRMEKSLPKPATSVKL